jgi:acid stress chaperone HdeA
MKSIAPATIAVAMLLFSGCSASHVTHTGGGDTKCKDFTVQDETKQNEEVSQWLKDKTGAEPNKQEISATRSSAWVYCQTNPNSNISAAPAECWRCHYGASRNVGPLIELPDVWRAKPPLNCTNCGARYWD